MFNIKSLHALQQQCALCARNKVLNRWFSGSSYLCASGRVKRERARAEREEVVFQYAGKDPKRAARTYGWGFAETGALGVRHFLRPDKGYKERYVQFIPHRLEFFDRVGLTVVNGACGYGFTVFVCNPKEESHKYQLYGCGINTDNQLGYHEYPHNSGRILGQLIEPAQIPLPLENRDRAQIHGVSCGRAHTVIHTSEAVFSIGNNVHGQCGRTIVEGEDFSKSQMINRVNIDPQQVKQVECGQDHTLFVMENGEVYACGLSSDGQTGQGHYDPVDKVSKVTGAIEGEKIVQVSSKADTVLALSDKGEVFGWGNSEYSQFSVITPDETQVNTSRHLPFTQVGKVTRVAAAGLTCALVNDAGDVFVWGYGILGKGPNVDSTEFPTCIPPTLFGRNEFNTDSKVKDIQSGVAHFMAITTDGDLYSWGKNRVGALGLANHKDQFFPFKVILPAEARKVCCGIDHTVVLARAFV